MSPSTKPAPTASRDVVRRVRARTRARGAVLVEYAFLLVAVAVPTVMGMTAGGLAMLKEYQTSRGQILQSTP